METSNPRKAWVVWINSDLTEGRGFEIPLAICEIEATARRLAKGASTQGSYGRVEMIPVHKNGRLWYGPVVLKAPSREDKQFQKQLDMAYEAHAKALEAGLTREEIAALKNL